ncbi:hypothetical protein ACE38W_14455 [Chitinophaga sp. Hz27]|uniref:hypothetical protein n=1 Tax=Chitinophaga sp. Hz27 TaxID=3347169 RepID=UPI0035DBF027
MRILLLDPDKEFINQLINEIDPHYHQVRTATTLAAAKEVLLNNQINIVVMASGAADMQDKNFIDILKHRNANAIIYSQLYNKEEKMRYMSLGAIGYCSKDPLYILGELVTYKNNLSSIQE